jgi:hypothetical protein
LATATGLIIRLLSFFLRKVLELEEELKVVGNNLKSLEVSEEKVGREALLLLLRILQDCRQERIYLVESLIYYITQDQMEGKQLGFFSSLNRN